MPTLLRLGGEMTNHPTVSWKRKDAYTKTHWVRPDNKKTGCGLIIPVYGEVAYVFRGTHHRLSPDPCIKCRTLGPEEEENEKPFVL